MTSDRTLPKYVKLVPRGKQVHVYFRHRGFYKRLPKDTASAEFHAEYAKALAAIETPSAKPADPQSVHALITDYKASPEFTGLAAKTQRDYARALDHLGKSVGRFKARAIRRADVIKLRNKVATRGTRAADFWVSVIARCFKVGLDLGYVDVNPAAEIGRVNVADPYVPWPREQRLAFEASNPPDRLMRAYMLSLYTSLRLGDTLALPRTLYDGTGFSIHHTKSDKLSGEALEYYIPATRVLREYLAGLPADGLLFVLSETGRRMSERSFSDEFRGWLDKLGPEFEDLHFHGLRKSTATALVESGASSKELQAVLGWRTLAMAEHYTRAADQKKLAIAAIRKFDAAHRRGTKAKPKTGNSGG